MCKVKNNDLSMHSASIAQAELHKGTDIRHYFTPCGLYGGIILCMMFFVDRLDFQSTCSSTPQATFHALAFCQ